LRLVGGAAAAAGAGACGPTRVANVAPRTAPSAINDAGLIRIGSNENGSGPGPAALEAIRSGVSESNRYPFATIGELVSSIATSLRIDSSQVLLGSGSGELLDASVTAFTASDRGVLTAAPSFEMPAMRAQALDRPVVAVPVDPAGRLDLDAMMARSSMAGLVYVCNPNNPTSTVHTGADVEAFVAGIRKRAPDAVVLVDEAYHEYVELAGYHSLVPLAITDPHVIVTRTFSKIHGIAGLRVGYAVGVPQTLARLRRWVDALNMNTIGVAAAHASLGDSTHVAEQKQVNHDTRTRLLEALAQAGHRAFESNANFVMVHVGRDPRSFAAACLAKGVQVARPFPPLMEHARITIGTPGEMERATRVFLDVLAQPAGAAPSGGPVTAWTRDDGRRVC
jgi:histidinol-phosphate aminotransferase